MMCGRVFCASLVKTDRHLQMRLLVIATDYDGTIATDGVLHPAARAAINNARERNVLVVIVTGRILSELRAVAGGLDFVDGVVAENGAVVALQGGHTMQLGQTPPMSLLTALTERGIDFKVGRCVVEMDASFSNVAMSLIREQELPLAVTFNRQRMMLLPPSISKASGLKELLNAIGVSMHNSLGIGDAENDHELLRCCEYGVAVDWGSERLKASADEVIPGRGPEAVGAFVDRVSQQFRLPLEHRGHHKVVLDAVEGQPPLEIAIQGRNVLIAGDTQSGKSWLAGLLMEQMIFQRYTVYVFDPEGDYSSLGSLPNTVVLGGGRLLPQFDDLLTLLQQGLSVVLDLSHLPFHEKLEYTRQHLPLVARYRWQRGFPHRILLDESHYFLNGVDDATLLDLDLGAYTLVTWQPSKLSKAVALAMDIVAVTRLAEKTEVDAIARLSGDYIDPSQWYEPLADLTFDQAALLPPTTEANGQLLSFHVAPRLTHHVRHCTKYLASPVAPDKVFVFSENSSPTGRRSATLCELVNGISESRVQVVQAHIRRHDFSRWIGHIFGDVQLAALVRELESNSYSADDLTVFREELAAAIKKRYESPDPKRATVNSLLNEDQSALSSSIPQADTTGHPSL